MKNIAKYLYEVVVLFFTIIFQVPNKKFDEITGNKQEQYDSLVGRRATVTEEITNNKGMVRYSGSNWKARLAETSEADSIKIGNEVAIKYSSGNVLYVV